VNVPASSPIIAQVQFNPEWFDPDKVWQGDLM
jgi:hypothetical protein